jgi:hypothetical protein
MRNSCSYFDFSCDMYVALFFSGIVFNACRLARYLEISFVCWIRLLNVGIILWLDTACWRYEVRTAILCILRTRIHCFSIVSDCAGNAAVHCVSAILNVYTRKKMVLFTRKVLRAGDKTVVRFQLKCDGTRWRTGGEVKRKLARLEWVASTLHTTSELGVTALLPLMRTPRLPVVDWTDAPADLNGLVRFAERRNLVSARVPSHFKRSLFSTPIFLFSQLLRSSNLMTLLIFHA